MSLSLKVRSKKSDFDVLLKCIVLNVYNIKFKLRCLDLEFYDSNIFTKLDM